MASEEVTRYRNKQPEPRNEDEHREDFHKEISVSEPFCCKEHHDLLSVRTRLQQRKVADDFLARKTEGGANARVVSKHRRPVSVWPGRVMPGPTIPESQGRWGQLLLA